MEPEIRKFFAILANMIAMLVLFFVLHILLGLRLGLLTIDKDVTVWNILYWIFLVGSFGWLLRYILKKWKQFPDLRPDKY